MCGFLFAEAEENNKACIYNTVHALMDRITDAGVGLIDPISQCRGRRLVAWPAACERTHVEHFSNVAEQVGMCHLTLALLSLMDPHDDTTHTSDDHAERDHAWRRAPCHNIFPDRPGGRRRRRRSLLTRNFSSSNVTYSCIRSPWHPGPTIRRRAKYEGRRPHCLAVQTLTHGQEQGKGEDE